MPDFRPRPILLAFALLSVGAIANAEWAGTEEMVDGVRHVINPELPAEGSHSIQLDPLWSLGGFEDDTIFGVISRLAEDRNGDVYMLDSQLSEISVYSPDGEYLRTIGREGEGPGEFRGSFELFIRPDDVVGVVQVFPGKIVQLTTMGEPAGNYPLPALEAGGFMLTFAGSATDNRLLLTTAMSGQTGQTSYLRSYDFEGNELARFHEASKPMKFGGMEFEENTDRDFTSRWAMAPDGRVACATDFGDYSVTIWNADGTVDRVITRPAFESVKRTGEEREFMKAMFEGFTSWNPGSSYTESSTHMTVQQLFFRPDGSLWVLSSEGAWRRDDGVFASFDVYDSAGRFQHQVNLLRDGDPIYDAIYFGREHIYVVTESLQAAMSNFAQDAADKDMRDEAEPIAVHSHVFPSLETIAAGR